MAVCSCLDQLEWEKALGLYSSEFLHLLSMSCSKKKKAYPLPCAEKILAPTDIFIIDDDGNNNSTFIAVSSSMRCKQK